MERRVADKALARYGVASMKVEPPLGSETGWPDRCFFIPGGRPFLLEFKEVGYAPEVRQEYMIDLLEDLGYDVSWTDNEEDALAAIQERVQQNGARVSETRDKILARARSRRPTS